MILLISFLLIAITVASVINGDSSSSTTTEQDIDQMTQEVIDELSSYIQIRDQKGYKNGEQRIEKIAILISPLVTQDIDVTQLTIQLDNGETVSILNYDGNTTNLESSSLFEHTIWNNLNGANFGFISIVDLDDSLLDYDVINDYSDNAYVIFKLPSSMTIEKYDTLMVTLFPSTGITRTTELFAHFSTRSVITFE